MNEIKNLTLLTTKYQFCVVIFILKYTIFSFVAVFCLSGISEDEAVSHRLYDVEVVELSEDVSIILLLPPVECVCSVPGHQEAEVSPNTLQCLSLPVQVFEMSKFE